jgi:hypothetical protein
MAGAPPGERSAGWTDDPDVAIPWSLAALRLPLDEIDLAVPAVAQRWRRPGRWNITVTESPRASTTVLKPRGCATAVAIARTAASLWPCEPVVIDSDVAASAGMASRRAAVTRRRSASSMWSVAAGWMGAGGRRMARV